MLDVLYIGAAVITVAGVVAWPVKNMLRRRASRRLQAANRKADLRQVVAEFTGAALSAHAHLIMLGRFKASWLPISEQTAVRFGEALFRETAPLTTHRSLIRFSGHEGANQAADMVLHVLEESADLLTRRKVAVRRVNWEARETAIAEAVRALEDVVRQD